MAEFFSALAQVPFVCPAPWQYGTDDNPGSQPGLFLPLAEYVRRLDLPDSLLQAVWRYASPQIDLFQVVGMWPRLLAGSGFEPDTPSHVYLDGRPYRLEGIAATKLPWPEQDPDLRILKSLSGCSVHCDDDGCIYYVLVYPQRRLVVKFPSERSSKPTFIDLTEVISAQEAMVAYGRTITRGCLEMIGWGRMDQWIKVNLTGEPRKQIVAECAMNNDRFEAVIFGDYVYYTEYRSKPFRINRKGQKEYINKIFAKQQIKFKSFGDKRFDILTLYDRKEGDTNIGMIDKLDGDVIFPVRELLMGGMYEISKHCLLIHNGVLKGTDGYCYAPYYTHHQQAIAIIPLMDSEKSLVRQ